MIRWLGGRPGVGDNVGGGGRALRCSKSLSWPDIELNVGASEINKNTYNLIVRTPLGVFHILDIRVTYVKCGCLPGYAFTGFLKERCVWVGVEATRGRSPELMGSTPAATCASMMASTAKNNSRRLYCVAGGDCRVAGRKWYLRPPSGDVGHF